MWSQCTQQEYILLFDSSNVRLRRYSKEVDTVNTRWHSSAILIGEEAEKVRKKEKEKTGKSYIPPPMEVQSTFFLKNLATLDALRAKDDCLDQSHRTPGALPITSICSRR